QLAQELPVPVGEPHRRLDHDLAHEIARVARAQALDALAAQPKHLPGLRLRRHLDLRRAVESGNLDLAAEGRLGEADRHLAVQVVAVTLEDAMLGEVDDDVEVAGRAPVDAGFALGGEADAIALVDARRDLHRERLVALDASRAAAGRARIDDHLAGAVARGTGLLDGEEA